jgi:hypothetical protein
MSRAEYPLRPLPDYPAKQAVEDAALLLVAFANALPSTADDFARTADKLREVLCNEVEARGLANVVESLRDDRRLRLLGDLIPRLAAAIRNLTGPLRDESAESDSNSGY